MTLRKHGLGRGLEALLVGVSVNEEKQLPQTAQPDDDLPVSKAGLGKIQPSTEASSPEMKAVAGDVIPSVWELRAAWMRELEQYREQLPEIVDGQAAIVVALLKNIQRENLVLQEEAGTLRQLIEELESMVRIDLS